MDSTTKGLIKSAIYGSYFAVELHLHQQRHQTVTDEVVARLSERAEDVASNWERVHAKSELRSKKEF